MKNPKKTTVKNIIGSIASITGKKSAHLHEPIMGDLEKKFINKCIDSNFVSSIGPFVDLFEKKIKKFTGAKYAVATVNGTSAIHAALHALKIMPNEEVLIPAFNFVASANATLYCNAVPHFIDVEKKTLGIDFEKLER